MAAITYMGGRCQNQSCPLKGQKIHPAAFVFHHVAGKNFGLGYINNRSWKVLKAELDKCVMLCVLCHHVHHSDRFDDEVFVEEAKAYGNDGFDLEIDWSLLPC